MTATTQERSTAQMGDVAKNDFAAHPVGAATKIYEGAMVALVAGYLFNVTAPAPAGTVVLGRAEATFDNTSGAAGAASVDSQTLGMTKLVVRLGTFKWANSTSTDAITQAHVGLDCYAADNQTVALTSTGSRSRAGIIVAVDSDGVWVSQGFDSVGIDAAAVIARNTRRARGVVSANIADLTAFTVASNDGLTYTAGQVVLLAAQTTAGQCGPYIVGTVTAGVAPLTRPLGWSAGSVIPNGAVYEISEGTLWAGSSWKAMCTGTAVVDTNDPLFYPRVSKGILTLASGTKTLGSADGLWLFSAAGPFLVSRDTAGGTVTSTIMYAAATASRTAGKSGTAAAIVLAVVAAGTINVADNSTVSWAAHNW